MALFHYFLKFLRVVLMKIATRKHFKLLSDAYFIIYIKKNNILFLLLKIFEN